MTVLHRLRAWLRQWLVAWDQLALVGLCFVPFVLLGRGICPDADETISSYVGRHALAGARWALLAETMIDRLFLLLGDGPGHCRRAIENLAQRRAVSSLLP